MEEKYMRRALDLAERAEGRTSPNPMVGAVVVKSGRIIGEGYHRRAGSPHAEIHALSAAGSDARGATLYVTLEPCNHYGRTPPCTEAIMQAGIARVIAACTDPNPLVAGSGLRRLAAAGIEVDCGLLQEEALRLNEVFIKYITSGKPFVVWKSAMTLDGKIASATGDSRWVTGELSREKVHQLRDKYDAIMVGIGTILADDPLLTTRIKGKGKDPVRIVADSNFRLPEDARVINQQSPSPTILAVTLEGYQNNLQKADKLRQLGVQFIVQEGGTKGKINLVSLLRELAKREITSLLLEGGAELAASFIEQQLVDKLHIFIAPKLLGGRRAPGPLGGEGILEMQAAHKIKVWRSEVVGEDLMITGYLQEESKCLQD